MSLWSIFLQFLKIGVTAFGGPAAHAGLMEYELVTRRQWLSRQQFLDYMGGVNLIPGPNSTQMTMLVGFQLRGFWGMILSGLGFIIPAALITGFLAYIYTRYQGLMFMENILLGIKPAILVIIASAVIKLGKKAVKNYQLAILGVLVIVVSMLGINEVTAILGAGVVGMLAFSIKNKSSRGIKSIFPFLALHGMAASAAGYSSLKLFWIFIKIGSLLFGTGYVLIAYVNTELVENLGWITPQQLLDAIAIGQFTPGPLLTSATFIGYLLDGYKGALIATAGIFLPSYIFILILYPLIGKLRKSVYTAAFLDSVNVAAVGVMAAVFIAFTADVITGWRALTILILAAFAVWGPWKPGPIWIVAGSALLGYLLYL